MHRTHEDRAVWTILVRRAVQLQSPLSLTTAMHDTQHADRGSFQTQDKQIEGATQKLVLYLSLDHLYLTGKALQHIRSRCTAGVDWNR